MGLMLERILTMVTNYGIPLTIAKKLCKFNDWKSKAGEWQKLNDPAKVWCSKRKGFFIDTVRTSYPEIGPNILEVKEIKGVSFNPTHDRIQRVYRGKNGKINTIYARYVATLTDAGKRAFFGEEE